MASRRRNNCLTQYHPSPPVWIFTFDPPEVRVNPRFSFIKPSLFYEKSLLHPRIPPLCCWLPAQAQVVITEIMYNPPEPGTDTLEYIELHNHGSSAVNLEGWKFTAGVTHTFPAGASLAANGYLVLTINATALKTILNVQNAIKWDGGALSNSGEAIVLADNNGTKIDSVKYGNAAPWPVEANGNGHSITLCDPSLDNADPANWVAATSPMGVVVNGKDMYGNPGAGCPSGTILANDQVNVPSGKPVIIDMLANDLIPGSTFVVSIAQNPSHGTATLSNNKITYTSSGGGYCGPDLIKYSVVNGGQTYTADIQIKVYCYPLYTIPQVHGEDLTGKADSANIYCELQGIVYGGNLVAKGLRFGLIDASNSGILINNDTSSTFGYTVKEGDKVRCFGQIQQIQGVTRMELDTLIKVSSNNPLVSPLVVDSLTEQTESRLVKSSKTLTLVNSTQWTTGMGASGFTVDATDGTTAWQLRIDNDVDLWNLPPPALPFYVTGIGSQFDNTSPFTAGYQIFPRRASDIQEVSATNDLSLGEKIDIAPNPVFDFLTVRSAVDLDRISVSSPTGQLMFSIEKPGLSESLNVQQLAPGIYFARFQKDGRSFTTRFLKL